jgi:hypothetical protein
MFSGDTLMVMLKSNADVRVEMFRCSSRDVQVEMLNG